MRRALHAAALCFLCAGLACAADVMLSFEAPADLQGWQAQSGKVSLSTDRFKSGAHSLCWEWTANDAGLMYTNPAAFADLVAPEPRKPGSKLVIWCYNEQPAAVTMTVGLGQGDRVIGDREVWMGFRGWRPLCFSYTDLGWKPGQAVAGLVFTFPRGGVAGHRVYFDCVRTNLVADAPSASYQLPWAYPPGGFEPDTGESHLTDANLALSRPWLPRFPDQVTDRQRQGMQTLAGRFLPKFHRPRSGLKPDELAQVREQFATLQIKHTNGILTGRPIDCGAFGPMPDAVHLQAVFDLCKRLQADFATAKRPAEIDALRGMFMDVCAHLLDQGWAEGSALSAPINPYEIRFWPPVFMLMRDELDKAGLLRDMALSLLWWTSTSGGDMYRRDPYANMDVFQCLNRNAPALTLMLPDDRERLHRLLVFQRYLEAVLNRNEPVGPDGSAYHHWMHHFAYASYSMPTVIDFAVKLQDTSFRLSPTTMARLQAYVRANAFACDKYDMPWNMLGRAGVPMTFNFADLAYSLATCGTPDGSQPLDPDMVGLFLTLCNKPDDARLAELTGKGFKPVPQTGHHTMNGAVAALHRRDDWLVSVVGMVKFWRGLEIYGWMENNNYGRYARNGSICVISAGDPPSLEASGFRADGWDWCHWPGATSPVRPQQDVFDGYTMYANSQPFAGGTSLGGDGIWGMDFIGRDVAFKRSVFCFDNRVTSVTTDLRTDQPLPVDTTLYQNALSAPNDVTWLNGRELTAFPDEQRLDDVGPHWLMDNMRTGYYVPAGHPPLRVRRGPQQWTYLLHRYLKDPKDDPIIDIRTLKFREKPLSANEKYFKPSTGDFALACFEHGSKPSGGQAAYTLVVKTTPEQMAAFAAAMATPEHAPLRVLQMDATAHVLWDRATSTTGYIIFDAAGKLPAGLLVGVGRPCLVMLREREQQLEVSMVSTDIALKDPLVLRLQGTWRAHGELPTGATLGTNAGNTVITISYDYNMPIRFALER